MNAEPNPLLASEREGPRGEVPIVLLHAGIADSRMWDPVWDTLTARHDVVRLDLRGFGDSSQRPSSAVDHADDVLSLMRALHIDRFHLVGASFGAGVAAEVALTAPGMVASLVLCPPGGSLLTQLTESLRAFSEAESSAFEAGNLDAAVEANVDAWVVGSTRQAAELDPALLDHVRLMQRRAFEIASEWGDVDAAEMDPPAADRLSGINARMLVIVGAHDMDTSREAAARVVASVQHARLVEWDDVAHLPAMERPSDFADLLTEWVGATQSIDESARTRS